MATVGAGGRAITIRVNAGGTRTHAAAIRIMRLSARGGSSSSSRQKHDNKSDRTERVVSATTNRPSAQPPSRFHPTSRTELDPTYTPVSRYRSASQKNHPRPTIYWQNPPARRLCGKLLAWERLFWGRYYNGETFYRAGDLIKGRSINSAIISTGADFS